MSNTTLKDYENSTIKPDYSMRVIISGLEAYTAMQEGKMPESENLGIQRNSDIPTCQAAAITKSDLDRAMSSLTRKELLCVVCYNIIGFDVQEIAYWLKCSSLDVLAIDDIAVKKMRKFLNRKG